MKALALALALALVLKTTESPVKKKKNRASKKPEMDQTVIDILLLPFFGQGHLNPCVELCKNLSSYNCKSILIIPSHLASSIPSSLHNHPLVELLQIPASYSPSPPPPPHADPQGGSKPRHGSGSGTRPVKPPHQDLGKGIESFLQERYKNTTRPGCVVMDVMMSWSKDIFMRENVPIVSFFTSGACSTAIEYAAWKARADEMQLGETRILPGLPESIALSYMDLKRRDQRRGIHRGPKGGPGGNKGSPGFGPPIPGHPPRWLDEAKDSIAFLINTCNDLEGPFLEYLATQIEKPVYGVGPLLPETYWKSIGSIVHVRDSRPNRGSNYTEDEVIQWLDSKPSQSVIYVSFGSEVGPTLDEYAQLADALEESNRFFIWVIQPGTGKPGPPANFFGEKPSSGSNTSEEEEGYYPYGLEEKVGDKGLIIKGWAPQLSILSHPSVGGFLSHCGWNSTVEAIGRGVPILAWPIRGDQFYDAKLLEKYLKVGHMVASGEELAEMVKRSAIVRGIEELMDDREVHERAIKLSGIFESGFPSSSVDSFKALVELISSNN